MSNVRSKGVQKQWAGASFKLEFSLSKRAILVHGAYVPFPNNCYILYMHRQTVTYDLLLFTTYPKDCLMLLWHEYHRSNGD